MKILMTLIQNKMVMVLILMIPILVKEPKDKIVKVLIKSREKLILAMALVQTSIGMMMTIMHLLLMMIRLIIHLFQQRLKQLLV